MIAQHENLKKKKKKIEWEIKYNHSMEYNNLTNLPSKTHVEDV